MIFNRKAQLLSYLKGARIERGLLINFGSYKFQIKKYVRTDTLRASLSSRLTSLFAAFFAFSVVFRG